MRLLTSFFDKSKPVHFFVLSGLVLFYYYLANFVAGSFRPGFSNILKEIGFLLVFFMAIGLLNFIAKRNRITQKNSYAALLFVVFTISFPEIFKSGAMLLAGFFLLLALRRIFSLKSGIEVKKKIFDTSLWISVSALFVESSILFLILVFLAVFFFSAKDYRNWIIPFFGILTAFVLYLVFHLLVNGDFPGLFSIFGSPSFHFSIYSEIPVLIPLSILLAFALWSLGDYIFIFKKTPGSAKNLMALVMATLAISALAAFLSPTKNSSELLFLSIPVAFLGGHFFQRDKDRLFKEVLLFGMIAMALIVPFL